MVVAGGVEGEVAEEFAGCGVDDADVEPSDEEDDVGSGVFSADSDVVEATVVSERDLAGVVDPVVSDSVVGARCGGFRGGFGAGLVDRGGRGPVWE